MLIKLLPLDERRLLLELCKLLALSDNPILWGGKTYDELTSDSDFKELSIQVDELENEMIAELEASLGDEIPFVSLMSCFSGNRTEVQRKLIEKLQTYPISKVERVESRTEAASMVLSELLADYATERPEIPKIMLYELILVAFKDGTISDVEMSFLKTFQKYFQLEDFMFDELMERAIALNNELSKTLAIVLE